MIRQHDYKVNIKSAMNQPRMLLDVEFRVERIRFCHERSMPIELVRSVHLRVNLSV